MSRSHPARVGALQSVLRANSRRKFRTTIPPGQPDSSAPGKRKTPAPDAPPAEARSFTVRLLVLEEGWHTIPDRFPTFERAVRFAEGARAEAEKKARHSGDAGNKII